MKKLLTTICLLALAGAAHAQAPVTGALHDAAGRGLPFATAVLLHYHCPHMGMPPLLATLARNDCSGAVITSRQGSG